MEEQKDAKEDRALSEAKFCEDKDNRIKEQEDKIEALEQQLLELKVKADSEIKHWKEVIEKNREECDEKVHILEKQLQLHGTSNLPAQVGNNLAAEIESLKLQAEEKESVIQNLQTQLKETASDNHHVVESLRAQLDTKARELEDFSMVKQQLQEREEQLRLRQTALLDMQADKEQLQQEMGQVEELKHQLELKAQVIAEQEGILRFRQTCILDLVAEKERIIEERDEIEADLKKQLQEKEISILDIKRKYEEQKKGNNVDVIQIVEDKWNSLEEEVDEVDQKLLYASDNLTDITAKEKQAEEKMSQISQQLIEREEQIKQLQDEIKNLKLLNGPPEALSVEMGVKVQELERQLQEAREKAEMEAASAAESQEVTRCLERELAVLKEKNTSRKEVLSPMSTTFSSSLPLHGARFGDGQFGLSRWDSEPAGLEMDNRESVHLLYRMTEMERISLQQRRELSEKNQELGLLRQNLERWLEMRKGQDSLLMTIQVRFSQILIFLPGHLVS